MLKSTPVRRAVGHYESRVYLATIKDLNVVQTGGRGVGWRKNLVKAVFMSVYCRLAANSIQRHVKKGKCPKPFWPGL